MALCARTTALRAPRSAGAGHSASRRALARAPAPRRNVQQQRVSLRVSAHGAPAGHGAATAVEEKNKNSGFVAEMRKVAMRLHTKEQAPKEGKAAPKQPMRKFEPTREGYLAFLVESKAVYDTMERIMAEAPDPQYERFQNTGLERAAPLAKDIAWMAETYGLSVPEVQADGPGATYSKLLEELAESNPPAFICHYYNTYFAHTAGGRMIGSKVAGMILDDAELEFYQYEGELTQLLENVRGELNSAAEAWTADEKEVCLDETMQSFKYSGGIMQCIMQS